MNIKRKVKKILRTMGLNFYVEVDWTDEKNYVTNIKQAYFNSFGKKLNLDNPTTFSEKMQWLKVYDSIPAKTRLADKYLCREYVKNRIGAEYLIPLLGVYDSFEEIDFDKLPERFVLQCNHGCGYNLIVKDKSKLDLERTRVKVNGWLEENMAYKFGEMHYKDIQRKIIISEYLEELNGEISDYKYFCFNGEPKSILYITDRSSREISNSFFDLEFNNLEFNYTGRLITGDVPGPKNLSLMTELAKELSTGFKHVRIDFYNIDGKIYFGEFTFTGYGGWYHFSKPEWDKKFGDMLDIEA